MKGLVDFDGTGFQEGILLAMGLGIPDDEALRPTFIMPGTTEVPQGTSVDPDGVPFNPFVRRNRIPGARLQVRCAVEFLNQAGDVTDYGVLQNDQARLTLLDPQYQQIKGFESVLLGDVTYNYSQTFPPIGLASATVWQVLVRAEDQT